METFQALTPEPETARRGPMRRPSVERAVHSFVAGYLRARHQSLTAQLMASPGTLTVRYGAGMSRQVEHWIFEPRSDLDAVMLSDGDWLTLIGDGPPPSVPADLTVRPLKTEYFMGADLGALCRELDGAQERFAAVPASEFPAPDCAVFRHEERGQTVSSVRCAAGLEGDAVVDRLATEPVCRGRGMARSLLRAAAGWALAQGGERMLLIASLEGYGLYRRLGFETLSPVRVLTLERLSHAR